MTEQANEASHLNNTVEGLLDVKKIQSKKGELEINPDENILKERINQYKEILINVYNTFL